MGTSSSPPRTRQLSELECNATLLADAYHTREQATLGPTSPAGHPKQDLRAEASAPGVAGPSGFRKSCASTGTWRRGAAQGMPQRVGCSKTRAHARGAGACWKSVGATCPGGNLELFQSVMLIGRGFDSRRLPCFCAFPNPSFSACGRLRTLAWVLDTGPPGADRGDSGASVTIWGTPPAMPTATRHLSPSFRTRGTPLMRLISESTR